MNLKADQITIARELQQSQAQAAQWQERSAYLRGQQDYVARQLAADAALPKMVEP